MSKSTRQERQLKRWAMGGGEPPEPIRLTRWQDPLEVLNAEGKRCEGGLRNLWHGCSAFLVGGGPSLNAVDLSLLSQRGVASLGINNSAAYAPCSAFVCGDPANKFHHAIYHDPKILKFVPKRQLKARIRRKINEGKFRWETYCVKDCPATFGIDRGSKFDPATWLTTPYCSWGAKGGDKDKWVNIRFTFFLGLRLMHFLGCRRVYLLGVDMTKAGHSQKYAWGHGKEGDRIVQGRENDGHWGKAKYLLEVLKPHFDKAGFQVLDAGPLSELGVFPRVDYEVAVRDCQQLVGPLPPSVDGWYSKKPSP